MTFQLFSVRTTIDALAFIISKISRAKRTRFGVCFLLIFETLLISKARIALAELDVGDVRVHLFLFADRQTVQRIIVAIGGEFFAKSEPKFPDFGKTMMGQALQLAPFLFFKR